MKLNLPNKLSIIRICLIPIIMFMYMQNFWVWGKLVALGLFVLAIYTDMLDGKIARKCNMVTDLGKLLDTNADKILIFASLLLVVVDGTIPNPYGIIVAVLITGRDMVISAFRQIAASKNFVMAADKLGKIKAAVIDVAVAMLMLLSYFNIMFTAQKFEIFMLVYSIVCYVVIGIGVVLNIWSMLNYMIKNKDVLTKDKKTEE